MTLEEFATERYAQIANKTAKSLGPEFWDNELLDLRAGFEVFCREYYKSGNGKNKKAKAKRAMKAMKA